MTPQQADTLCEQLTDAVERVLDVHDMLENGQSCSCGARNNMDGDLLHGHRIGTVSSVIEVVVRGFFNLPLGGSSPYTLDSLHSFTDVHGERHYY